ncbi:MAG TPA: hypothetical protein DCP97_04990 [Ruminococcaceae bacterium]|nr:hypothetical protein [Oscillospiraceae bacterium]
MTLYKDIIKPAVVLTLIALVVSLALAYTYKATDPVIQQAAKNAADLARTEVLKSADKFEEIKTEHPPKGLIDAYKAVNGAGYVFTTQYKGFGGPLKVMVGIKSDGKISGVKVLESSETPGLGTKVGEVEHTAKFIGKDAKLENVDAIAGVTISSGALKGAVMVAFEAFDSTGAGKPKDYSVEGYTKIQSVAPTDDLLEAYKADNGTGFMFITKSKGYGGDMVVRTFLDAGGTIKNVEVIANKETPELGENVANKPYISKFIGKKGNADDVAVISGASISSKALIKAVNNAFAAYEIVKGGINR